MLPFSSSTSAEEVVDAFASRVKGRVFLITGSAGGLGTGIALALATKSPSQIILLARSEATVENTIAQITAINTTITTTSVLCDLTDFNSVREAAQKINSLSSIPKIDVIINNAGIMNVKDYTLDKQGHELTLSANHLGHFLLTNLIMPKVLAAGPGARIIGVTSNGYRISPFHFDDPDFSGGRTYDGWTAYGQSKTAVVLFCVELAQRLKDRGIHAYSVHPGIVITKLGAHLVEADYAEMNPTALRNTGRILMDGPYEFKSVQQGVAPIIAASLDPALDDFSGSYIENCQITEALDFAVNHDNAKLCWKVSEDMVGEKFSL